MGTARLPEKVRIGDWRTSKVFAVSCCSRGVELSPVTMDFGCHPNGRDACSAIQGNIFFLCAGLLICLCQLAYSHTALGNPLARVLASLYLLHSPDSTSYDRTTSCTYSTSCKLCLESMSPNRPSSVAHFCPDCRRRSSGRHLPFRAEARAQRRAECSVADSALARLGSGSSAFVSVSMTATLKKHQSSQVVPVQEMT